MEECDICKKETELLLQCFYCKKIQYCSECIQDGMCMYCLLLKMSYEKQKYKNL